MMVGAVKGSRALFSPAASPEWWTRQSQFLAGGRHSDEMCNGAAAQVGNAAHRAMLRVQHYFFFPILLFARFSWCEQSVSHNISTSKVRRPAAR